MCVTCMFHFILIYYYVIWELMASLHIFWERLKMYTNTKAGLISQDGETELFDITAGVLKGDTFPLFFFIIVLHYARRRVMAGREEEFGFTITPRKSIRHPVEVLADLDFVDNIALLSYTIEQAQLLHRVESECKKSGFWARWPQNQVRCL